MTYVLNARERKLLDYLQIDHKVFQIRGQLPVGSGNITLDRLTSLGCWKWARADSARPAGDSPTTAGAACMGRPKRRSGWLGGHATP